MISWIKLDINILDDTKIKIIRSHPDGDKVVVLWIGLLCLAMKSSRPGTIEISDGLPYTIDDLSNLFNLEKKTVEMGIALFCKYRMIEIFDGGTIEVINFAKHQKLEEIEHKRELTRKRVENFRNRNKQGNALLTHDSVTVTITDKDKDLDKDIDKDIGDKSPRTPKHIFKKPTLEEVTEYCLQRKNNVNPQIWIDHYTSNGWMVGKNSMKDWKAAIRTWELRNIGGGNNGTGSKTIDTYRRPYRTERDAINAAALDEADIINRERAERIKRQAEAAAINHTTANA